ncbi:MAG: PepSY domain-containing protein [Gemmataceae bacterium]
MAADLFLRESFFRLVWRWHFWIGLIVTPTLLAVSLSGAVFVFKDDFLDWNRANSVFVSPESRDLRPVDEQIDFVKRLHPHSKIGLVTIPAERNRSTMVQFKPDSSPTLIAYVDPYTAEIKGVAPLALPPFWSGMLSLHRQLFAGFFGRVLVELTTAWCVVLILSGVYLGIPKRWKWAGVGFMRWRAHRYTVLRDWHTVPSLYFAPIAFILCVTGLFFSPVWSEGYSKVTGKAGSYPVDFITAPPATRTSLDRSPIPVSAIVQAANERYPGRRIMLVPPTSETQPYTATVFDTHGTVAVGFLAMDRSTGEIVADRRESELPFLGRVRLWIYSLHVGSIGGTTTKLLAALACLILAFAAVSGVGMWIMRMRKGKGKEKGQWALPRQMKTTRMPLGACGLMVVFAVLLPTVGASLVVILLGDWIYGKLTRTG